MRIRSTDDEDLDIMDLSQVLDRTDNSDDFSTHAQGELTMATKKSATAAKAETPAVETPAPKGKKTKAAAAPAAPEPKPEAEKGTFGPRAVPEGYTGINVLADELGTTPAAMRRRLRGMEGMTKPEGQHGWYWKNGSKELAAVKKAFATEPAAK